jgi:hypothetical protein
MESPKTCGFVLELERLQAEPILTYGETKGEEIGFPCEKKI